MASFLLARVRSPAGRRRDPPSWVPTALAVYADQASYMQVLKIARARATMGGPIVPVRTASRIVAFHWRTELSCAAGAAAVATFAPLPRAVAPRASAAAAAVRLFLNLRINGAPFCLGTHACDGSRQRLWCLLNATALIRRRSTQRARPGGPHPPSLFLRTKMAKPKRWTLRQSRG